MRNRQLCGLEESVVHADYREGLICGWTAGAKTPQPFGVHPVN